MITGDQIACEGGGVGWAAGKGKPAGSVLEQCETQSEKSGEEGRWVSRGLDHSPLASRAPGAVGMDAIRGAQCVSAGPGRGRKEVAGQRRLERHPCVRTSRLRPRRGDRATTPKPRGPRRHPFPGRRCPPAPGGRGLRPLPTLPPCPASLPARCVARSPARSPTLTSPAAPAAPPLPGAPPPTPGRKSGAGSESRGAQRVGTRGASAPGTGSDRSPRLQAELEPV